MEKEQHLVALSGGKDSTAMALALQEIEPRDYTYICTPTGDELDEMLEHWLNLGRILGKPIVPVTNGQSLGGIIRAENILPNWRMRWCTRRLKIEPFQRYLINHLPATLYVGIRADESDRPGADYDMDLLVNTRFPFQEWGWGIGDVTGYLKRRGVDVPERTDCGSCFFQTLWEWYVVWRDHRSRWDIYEGWESSTGYTLRSDQRDTWPAALAGLRERFEAGDIPKRRSMKDRDSMCTVCAR